MLKIAWDERYVMDLPEGHRFPMKKYEILPEQLLREGTIDNNMIFHPDARPPGYILSVHDEEYWEQLRSLRLSEREIRRTGFPLTEAVVEREIIIANGTIECVRYALQYGIAMNIAGGTHHAFTNRGEGFCLLNDQAMASRAVLAQRPGSRVLIVDLDVHQGNGTAQIFKNDPNVFTFSMHGANNYPLLKEKSDLDIALPDFTDDHLYLTSLERALNDVMTHFAPTFIFYQAGVDILKSDKLGRLSVSREGCKRRDELVFSLAVQGKVPIVVCMGGGYSPEIRDIVEAHANTFRLAQFMFF